MRHQPRILLATTRRWFAAARLAISFARVGFEVEAVCPSGGPLHLVSILRKTYALDGLRPLQSLRAAIVESEPDWIVPCDDLAAIYLHSLHKAGGSSTDGASRACQELIERSLGDPSSYPLLESRAAFITILAGKGVLAPKTASLKTVGDLRSWCDLNGFPAVLKADGTWSGDGVRVVTNLTEAARAFCLLDAPATASTVIKQAFAERDFSLVEPWLRRTRRSVSIQSFVSGGEGNIAVACSAGKVLASISADVVHTWSKRGPSSIIRVLPDGEMLEVATTVARVFGLSGLFGLDFILDPATGRPLLIEINPRATQTSHLPLGPGHDLAAALFTRMTGRPSIPTCLIPREEIALFPLAWQGHPLHPAFQSSHHDVPWEEPLLVRAGEAEIGIAAGSRWVRLWRKAKGPGF